MSEKEEVTHPKEVEKESVKDPIEETNEQVKDPVEVVKEQVKDLEHEEKEDPEEKEELMDDLVDEERLKEEEESLSEDELNSRYERSKNYKKEGNDAFGRQEYRESVFTYTKGLLICPLREKEFRSILYANRSAAKIKMDLRQSAIEDCTRSLENKPDYVRALLRRAKLYEQTEKLDEALKDYTKVLELDPSVGEARLAAQRLPAEINERNEKLKTEMLSKLKDLGNMVLRPFGLSTENFNLQQNDGGGYSINFNQNK